MPEPKLPARPRPRGPLTSLQLTAVAAVAGLLLAGGTAALAGPYDSSGQRVAEARRAAARPAPGAAGPQAAHRPLTSAGLPSPAPSAGPVLDGLRTGGGDTAGGRGPALAGRLDPLLAVDELGKGPSASVVDLTSGEQVYGNHAARAATPASVTKIATAVAALDALGPDHRIRTRVEKDGHRLVLVGGGDPTLTARAHPGEYASLRTLARRTAEALGTEHGTYTLVYDTSRYAGTTRHPIGPNENLAPVTPLIADEGRLDSSDHGPADRSTDPALDTARRFHDLLAEAGVKLRDEVETGDGKKAPAEDSSGSPKPGDDAKGGEDAKGGKGGKGGEDAKGGEDGGIASVSSAPLATIVERMLTYSDNDIAEHLARQTALATGAKADFKGGARAVHDRLDKLGLPVEDTSFHDGSGLDRADKLTPGLLTALLAEAARKDQPGLRPVLTGLPVAGFTGTLATRYTAEHNKAGTGLVRAKTGTLTGVNTLAGTVVTRSGRLLGFAFMSHDAPDPMAAQAALDKMATALAES
ncbi:D-alanyl-D-alanine carboxypeptidase/D-alanyl-D-alanine endopeptidase [Streptomyces sp. CLI2509]|uniref:D-alanyl-D-alanine carboxypeptidase/D-alanyl-D-alanine endopeptidase n=1 Tax=Streptomyces sp. CLI2509 TaxID=1984801 RepID=UPI001F0266C1|nr:D-alanyl-D-alanine carboxypeptidase/D-alanyl-D-alanine-endopeptidase [Streptomyces sp. CLI2509]